MILLLGGLLGKKRPGPAAQIIVCEAKRRARGKAVGAVHLSRKGLRGLRRFTPGPRGFEINTGSVLVTTVLHVAVV